MVLRLHTTPAPRWAWGTVTRARANGATPPHLRPCTEYSAHGRSEQISVAHRAVCRVTRDVTRAPLFEAESRYPTCTISTYMLQAPARVSTVEDLSLVVTMRFIFLPERKHDLCERRLLFVSPVNDVWAIVEHTIVVLQSHLLRITCVERAQLLFTRVEERERPTRVPALKLHLRNQVGRAWRRAARSGGARAREKVLADLESERELVVAHIEVGVDAASGYVGDRERIRRRDHRLGHCRGERYECEVEVSGDNLGEVLVPLRLLLEDGGPAHILPQVGVPSLEELHQLGRQQSVLGHRTDARNATERGGIKEDEQRASERALLGRRPEQREELAECARPMRIAHTEHGHSILSRKPTAHSDAVAPRAPAEHDVAVALKFLSSRRVVQLLAVVCAHGHGRIRLRQRRLLRLQCASI